MFAEASCAGVIRTARNVVADFGESAAASNSEGLLQLSKRRASNGERDCHRLMAKKLRLSLPIPKTFLETKDPLFKVPYLSMKSWMRFLSENNCLHILSGLVKPNH